MVALNVIGVNLITPVLPSYATHFGVGITAASFLITIFALARTARDAEILVGRVLAITGDSSAS